MPNLGPWEIILFLLVVMLLFGAKRLPEIGRSVGHGIRELKDSVSSHTEDVRSLTQDVRAEVDDLRQSVSTTDIRDDLALPSLSDPVAPSPAPAPKRDAVS